MEALPGGALAAAFAAVTIVAVVAVGAWVAGRRAARGRDSAMAELREDMRGGFRDARQESHQGARDLRDEVGTSIAAFGESQHKQLESVLTQMQRLTESSHQSIAGLRDGFTQSVARLQESNEKRLDQMREVVDERLQSTLEKRLGESFKLVSERLAAVHDGLGEMRKLASDVDDLTRVLGNVRARGIFGEVQLGALLEQILTPAQYDTNVETRPGSNKRVEFAVRLPGADSDQSQIWLPIDSKFPLEDYRRLVDAEERADLAAVETLRVQLERSVRSSARDIREKYVEAPHTTPFAILFLPTESLFAEVLRRPGLVESLQERDQVMITGPTTISALLNSLRVGFRTLAIQQRSAEVWRVLGAVKSEFARFGDVLDRVRRQLSTASISLEELEGRRTRVMERRLRDVEELSPGESVDVLGLVGGTEDDEPD